MGIASGSKSRPLKEPLAFSLNILTGGYREGLPCLRASPDVRAYLTGLITKMVSVVRDVKWVRNEGIHITVKFLGEIEEEKVRLMEQVLAPVGEEFAPFKVTLDSIDAFPDKRRARVIVVRLKEGVDTMRTIFSGLEAGLATVGIERETREFTPHLTLGRRRSPAPFPETRPLLKREALMFPT